MEFVSLAFIGPDSERGALAVEAAAQQDKGWEMAETLFAAQGDENSGWLSDDLVFSTAEEIGLDVDTFRTDFASDEVAEAIFDNQSIAADAGVSSTPDLRRHRSRRDRDGAGRGRRRPQGGGRVGPVAVRGRAAPSPSPPVSRPPRWGRGLGPGRSARR